MLSVALQPDLKVQQRDVPTAKADEALIRVRLAGICNTDLEIVRGYMQFQGVLGHEFVGEVVNAGDAQLIGKRVCGEINLGCAQCEMCAQGLARHCAKRSVLGILGKDGCFAEYLTLPVRNLVEVPEGVSDEGAVFTEPLAAAYEILEQVHVDPRARVLVMGDGKLGLLCALVLATTGANVSIVGKHPAKLTLLHHTGVTTFCAPELPQGTFDIVVEATGSALGLKRAIEATRPRGTLVLKSTFHGETSLATAPIVIHELTMLGSRCGPFAPALRAMANRRIDPTPLLHERFALKDALQAFERASAPGVLKVLLAP